MGFLQLPISNPKTKAKLKILARHSPSATYLGKSKSTTSIFDDVPSAATHPNTNKVEAICGLCDETIHEWRTDIAEHDAIFSEGLLTAN